MSDQKNRNESLEMEYAVSLGRMIRMETVSSLAETEGGREKFRAFRRLLRELFPALFRKAEYTEFADGFVLQWKGRDPSRMPILFMNHHDVVEAGGDWTHAPFSGEVSEGKLWGRGTLDDKGGLWAMLQAAEELAEDDFVPARTIWFSSSSTEETTGNGAEEIVRWFQGQGIRFKFCLDEGGMIFYEPIPGAKASFAMIGVGEKGCADLRFVARSNGGHASMPEKDSPLVRLGKFMAEVDKKRIFQAELNPALCEMLRRFSTVMKGGVSLFLAHPERHRLLLTAALLRRPNTAALLQTTLAFTMAHGSEGTNVVPNEAWVVGNMRYSHHQGQEGSFRAVRKVAEKYGLEMEVMNPGTPSRIADYEEKGFRLVEQAIRAVFPGVIPAPYILIAASDARYFDRVCDQCIRFLPFALNSQQVRSIHGLDENVDVASLPPAVAFYKYLMVKEFNEDDVPEAHQN